MLFITPLILTMGRPLSLLLHSTLRLHFFSSSFSIHTTYNNIRTRFDHPSNWIVIILFSPKKKQLKFANILTKFQFQCRPPPQSPLPLRSLCSEFLLRGQPSLNPPPLTFKSQIVSSQNTPLSRWPRRQSAPPFRSKKKPQKQSGPLHSSENQTTRNPRPRQPLRWGPALRKW